MEYPFQEIEKKWQKYWEKKRLFYVNEQDQRPKYYLLSMFPYPSGALHMGHISNYSIADAVARYKIMQGYKVLQPMGYDAFGLPAENYAIEHNSHPKITTHQNIEKMRKQFKSIGFGYDWDREFATCDEEYYRWNQWIFLKMYEKGLIYRKSSFVNWCPFCQTVLANEQAEHGYCWRCETKVEQREVEQWFIKITDYAEELLDHSKLGKWPQRVITMQKNWIGKSYGTEIFFKIAESNEIIPVFTTRPDTIFGCTYMVLAAEHPLVRKLKKGSPNEKEIDEFVNRIINEDKILRTAEDTEKEGIFTRRYAINPVNGERIPIWIGNYVVMEYGSGAVMCVPAHDQRDFEFSNKYELPIKIVIQNWDKSLKLEKMKSAYVDDGIMTNSEQFDGMKSREAINKISEWMEQKGIGKKTVNYRLRDWGISRQRYWGTPIPIIYCDKCGIVPVRENELPVKLPDSVQVGKTTQNPLATVSDFVNTTCPKCGGPAKRETDTMDTFFDSSWYYARFCDPKNDKLPFDKEIASHWLPADQYIGGIEHACMHLLYARFFHKFFRDIGLTLTDEPFTNLLTQGMVTKDGAKMSKSKGNIVDPQSFIDRYGSDTIRVFMLFASPPEKDVEWNDEGLKGAFRFLNRIWILVSEKNDFLIHCPKNYDEDIEISQSLRNLRYSTHHTIKKVTQDIENRMQFNTAIAAIMEHLNNVTSFNINEDSSNIEKAIYRESIEVIPKLLSPFAPHLAEEIWEMLGHKPSILESGWIAYNKKFLVKNEITYVIQINGKLRSKVIVDKNTSKNEVEKLALADPKVQKYTKGKKIKKIIVVPKKLVNVVVE
ncbi:MAG: leucine--tRNA ligase [Candidatus Cloacimonetes bacterium]|nr:leucine--tRNA ligase [Candidatus Cloacimonadota bacterium]MBL7086241.1 leucine--tRNA ligase [Candidatus Cloacimonadota bacterium]